MEKYRVTLTTEERAGLERLVSTGRGAARRLCHARILLLADKTLGLRRHDEDIVAALSSSRRTVERVRRRFVTEGLEAALHPRPQPARPGKVKGDVEQRLLQLACSDPPPGRCRWTLQMLRYRSMADELVVLGLVDRVSVETVRQALKKTTSSPGSPPPGASRRMPTPNSSGAWRT
jgi:Homeodomain-like domain